MHYHWEHVRVVYINPWFYFRIRRESKCHRMRESLCIYFIPDMKFSLVLVDISFFLLTSMLPNVTGAYSDPQAHSPNFFKHMEILVLGIESLFRKLYV